MKTQPRSLKPEDWPRDDRNAWDRATRSGGLFDEQGRTAHWADTTRRSVQNDYGIWLQWCRSQGCIEKPLGAGRVTPEAVAGYLADLEARVSSTTRYLYVYRLHQVVSALYPESDWRWLKKIVNRLARLMTAKGDKREWVQDSSALLALGLELMHETVAPESDCSRGEALHSAIQYRDGLIIAFLATRPLRRTNFAAIELGRHLVRQHERWWIRFEAAETKQRQPIEHRVPDLLIGHLETYLATYRPVFPGTTNHNHLWASAKGGPLTGEGFYQRICMRTKHAFGRSVNPHLFRDCAATTIARHTPAQIGTASQVLGHTSLKTTERYYNQADSVSAGHDYQAALAALRTAVGGQAER